MKVKNICCIGAGYVGGPSMAVIANHCEDIQVNIVDIDENKIKKWNSKDMKDLPVFEKGLAKIIKKCRGINLHFTTNVKENIRKADLIFISVSSLNSLMESIVICFSGFLSWCMTKPNPALESVNAGQKIGTLLS